MMPPKPKGNMYESGRSKARAIPIGDTGVRSPSTPSTIPPIMNVLGSKTP